MIILDTDHLSFLYRDSNEGFEIGRRLANRNNEDVYVTILTYEEQMRGWLSYISKADTPERQVAAYAKLRRLVETYRRIPILDYDEAASTVFESLRGGRVRIGSMDLKIAAIAISNAALLLSRNMSDFLKVPGLRVEDWSH